MVKYFTVEFWLETQDNQARDKTLRMWEDTIRHMQLNLHVTFDQVIIKFVGEV